MAEALATHDMEAYLINPTVQKEPSHVESQPHNMSGDLIPIFLADEIVTVKAGRKSIESAGSIHKFSNQSIFSNGYVSEEEAASPVEDNDFGFNTASDTESIVSIKETPSVENLTDHANALQLCTKAQAVQFVSAGRAKVVSVPKPLDLSLHGNQYSPTIDTPTRTSVSKRDAGVYDGSFVHTPSPRSSSDRSPASSSYEEQVFRPRTIRRKPKLPPLQAPTSSSQRSVRSQTPLADQRAEFLNYDPYPSNWPLGGPASASPTKLRMPKLSSSFSLKAFGRRRSNSGGSSASDGWDSPTEQYIAVSLPASPAVRHVPRTLRKSTPPKMVARGASERAPTLVLPPCPEGYDGDDNSHSSQWPLRKDSYSSSPTFETPNALKQIRRKSVSAAFATSQA